MNTFVSPHFSQGSGRFAYAEAVQRAVDTRRATENPGDVLDSTSRSLRERNTVDMVLCDAAV
jgi:hypothetical protein